MNYCNSHTIKKSPATVWLFNWMQPIELESTTLVVCIWLEQRQEMGKRNLLKNLKTINTLKKAKKADKCLSDINQCLRDTCNQYYI